MSVTAGSEGNPLPPTIDVTPEESARHESQPLEVSPQSTVKEVHHRARRGIKLLMMRQVGLQLFTFIGGIIIARKLGPNAFGLFGIAGFLVGMLAQFGDFGLAASFIQRKAELTERDLRVGFTLQQILLSIVVGIIFIVAPWLARLYPKAPPETVWLVRALAFSLYLTSWRTMSALQLERSLRYERLAWIEFLEIVIYQSFAVTLALMDKGAWSYVIATLVTGICGTVMVYHACPWKIRLQYDGKIAREILRFGIPFQLQMLVNQLGDWIIPLFVGARLGPAAVGLLTWSSANGKKPLIVIDNITRVAFPHFSRIQDDRAEVERTAARYLSATLAFGAFWFCVLLVAGPALVRLIYSGQWAGATTTLALYGLALSFDIISFVMSVALNGIGQVKFLAKIALARSVLYMLGSVPLTLLLGYNGVPIALLIAQAISMPAHFAGLGRGSMRRILAPTLWSLAPTAAGIGGGLLIRQLLLPGIVQHTLPPITAGLARLTSHIPLAWQTALRHADLTSAVQSGVLLPSTMLLFAGATWFFGPHWLRAAVRARLAARSARLAR